MNLAEKTDENVQYMVEEIMKKLKMATVAAIKPNHFGVDQYEDIKDLYEMITHKPNFSISEMEAIVSELGRLKSHS